MSTGLQQLAAVIGAASPGLQFTILEVGALQLGQRTEPFYRLLDLFPGSQIIGFEVEQALCDAMNAKAKPGVRYFPVALGERNERRKFYLTRHPMCASLYEPNQELLSLYNNFEVAYLKQISEIDTESLDHFKAAQGLAAIDFIKIDIQGAELDVFRGGLQALKDVLAIVCEVEFIPHYLHQPLFGDVCAFLSAHQLMFHKFIGLSGRTLRPILINKNPDFSTQHIWSDAMYIRHPQAVDQLTDQQLLKLSLLAAVYQSPDLSYFCLARYDQRHGSSLARDAMVLPAGGRSSADRRTGPRPSGC